MAGGRRRHQPGSFPAFFARSPQPVPVQRRAWSFGAPWLVVVNCGFFWTVHTVRVDIQLGERWPCILLKSFWHGPVQAWVIARTCLNAGPLSIQCRCLICRLSLPKGASPISSPTAVSRNKKSSRNLQGVLETHCLMG